MVYITTDRNRENPYDSEYYRPIAGKTIRVVVGISVVFGILSGIYCSIIRPYFIVPDDVLTGIASWAVIGLSIIAFSLVGLKKSGYLQDVFASIGMLMTVPLLSTIACVVVCIAYVLVSGVLGYAYGLVEFVYSLL